MLFCFFLPSYDEAGVKDVLHSVEGRVLGEGRPREVLFRQTSVQRLLPHLQLVVRRGRPHRLQNVRLQKSVSIFIKTALPRLTCAVFSYSHVKPESGEVWFFGGSDFRFAVLL